MSTASTRGRSWRFSPRSHSASGLRPADIYTEGIRRITPVDFEYAHQLHHTIRLICAARQTPDGLILSVRPSLIPQSTILASVRGAYNAVWVSGQYGADTFYYGRGAGPHPTGVAVVSDLMRVAREIRAGSPERVSPFAHARLGEYMPIPITLNQLGVLSALPRGGPAGHHRATGHGAGR